MPDIQSGSDRRDGPGPAPPERDDQGRLTRRGMEQVIERGGSVTLDHPKTGARVIATHVDHLPSEAHLARGDAARSREAEEALMRRREAIDAELAVLQGNEPARAIEAPAAPVGGASQAAFQSGMLAESDRPAEGEEGEGEVDPANPDAPRRGPGRPRKNP